MGRLRVAFVDQPWCSSFPPPTSSVEIWTFEVARRLAREHEVHIFGAGNARSLRSRSFAAEGVLYHVLPTAVDSVASRAIDRLRLYRSPLRPQVASSVHYGAWVNRAALGLRRVQPDVIHIHNQFPFVAHIRRLNPKAQIVLHMHSEWLSQLDRELVAPAVRASNAVLGCSHHVLSRARARHGADIRIGAVVPNGVDIEAFRAAKEQPNADGGGRRRILFVGRVSPEKGCHTLVEAFTRLAINDEQLELRLVGPVGALPREYIVDVSPEPFVRDLARYYDKSEPYWEQVLATVPQVVKKRITATGPLQRCDIAREISASDILVNPSLSESFGMALVEAMACGIPVVATAVGGMPEVVVDGVTGTVVPQDDSQRLAAAIRELLEDPAKGARMGAAGREHVRQQFTWQAVAERTLSLYQSLSPGRTGPANGERFPFARTRCN